MVLTVTHKVLNYTQLSSLTTLSMSIYDKLVNYAIVIIIDSFDQ